MKLGVVAALRTEIRPTLEALSGVSPFQFAAAGVGAGRAATAARALAGSVDALLSVGFCGALDDSLLPGDLILGGSHGFEPSRELMAIAERAGPHRKGIVGMVDHVVMDGDERKKIAAETGALAVDMESAAVGRVARELGRMFLCAKVVLDTPSRPLACAYSSGGSVALQILRRPWILPRMWGDGRRARAGAERLKDFFLALRKEINPSEG